MFDNFSEEDEEFDNTAPIQNPRTLVAVLKAEAAQMLSSCDWFDPMIRNLVNKEEWRSKAVELNVTSAMVEEAHSLDDDSAWDKMRVDLLQRASKDHDGSSMTFFLEASREAQFELAEAYRYGRFGLREDALKACAYYAKAGAPLTLCRPLATLAFMLCAVGDIGLKTGWVRCANLREAGWVRCANLRGYHGTNVCP